MANPIQRFLFDRFIQPALTEQAGKISKASRAFGYGVVPYADVSLRTSIGQPTDTDHQLLYQVYRIDVDVKGCVQKWVSGVTSRGWHLEHVDPNATATDAWNALVDDTEAWLRNPNPNKPFSMLAAEAIQHLGIAGDAFWNVTRDKKGRPLEIWPLHPIDMRVKADEHGAITGYLQRTSIGKDVDFDPSEVQQFRLPNPYNDLYGESPLSVALEDIGLDLQAMRSNRAIFANGMKLSAVGLADDNLSAEESKALAEMIRTQNVGAGNQHGFTLLAGVKDIKQWGSTLKDMEFTALRELSTQKVTTAYGIPMLLLGYHNAGDYASSQILYREAHESTFRPIQEYTAQIITENILQTIDEDLRFVWNQPDFSNQETKTANFLLGETRNIILPNEVREQLGLASIDGLDEAKQERADAAAAALAGQGSDTDVNPDNAPDETETPAEESKSLHKSISGDELEAIRDRREEQLDDLEATIIPQLEAYMSRHQDRLTAKLENAYTSTEKGIIDDQADAIAYGDADVDDRDLRMELYADLELAARAGVAEGQLQIQFGLTADVQQAIVDQYLLKDALTYVTSINDTTREAIRDGLRAGLAAGEGIDELKARITDYFDKNRAYRAQTIARTEVARAYEDTNLKALIASGIVESEQWLSARDERTRPTHLHRDGLIVSVGETWGGIRPGEEINCRCTSVGILKEDDVEA